jgi:methylenetetrahydrofolate reductase (NADPH)
MQIGDILGQAKEPLMSFEIIPPYRGKSATHVYNIIDELIKFSPPFIDVTSHAAAPIYLEQGDGSFKRKSTRKRPGTIGLCAAIKYRYNVEAVPHILCGGFNRQETEDALIELSYIGIDNVLAITGDAGGASHLGIDGKLVNNFSVDLVNQISAMNEGKYQDEVLDSAKSNFCIGVGAYPEKHPQSPSLEQDIRYLKAKIDAGADYIVTQMFFNNSDYFSFVELCRLNDINVPIIPGIKLITKQNQLKSLPKHFSVNIPDDLVREMESVESDIHKREIGIEFSIMQCEELLQAGVPALHFYVMQDVKNIKQIVSTLKKY